MSELTEELFGYAEDAIKTNGNTCLKDPACRVVDFDEVIDMLLPDPEDSLAALHEFLDDEEERLELPVRQNFVKGVLRAAEGLPGLENLLKDPILQELID